MSELAYDQDGDAIALPASAQQWRVRRFRNPGMRGAPEVVLDRDGAPLLLPIDCTFVEFRELVDMVPGRYRLDPLDECRKVVPDVPAAYVSLVEGARNASMSIGGSADRDVIRELVRAQTGLRRAAARGGRHGGNAQASGGRERHARGRERLRPGGRGDLCPWRWVSLQYGATDR
jgi:hypothetical protein